MSCVCVLCVLSLLSVLCYEMIFTTASLSLPDAPGLNTDLAMMVMAGFSLPAQHWEILCSSDVNADS